MALSPKVRRELHGRYLELRKELLKGDAYSILAREFDIHPATVAKHVVAEQSALSLSTPSAPSANVEVLTSSDFEMGVSLPETVSSTIIVPGRRTLEMVASDIHYPYEDKAAYALFLEVLQDLQPDVLVLLGDIMDCYAVSDHSKDPNRATPAAFRDELVYTRTKLDEIRSTVPDARIIYKQGNHETRLTRYISKNAAALSNLKAITLPELLDLHSLNMEWIPNDARLRIGKLWHIHGNEVGGSGMSPARLKYSRMQCSFIFGHLHCRDKYRPRAYDGSQHGAYANPCLCDLEPEYMHHTHAWSHGFTIIDHDTDGTFQVEETEIIKPSPRAMTAKCNVRGRIYGV